MKICKINILGEFVSWFLPLVILYPLFIYFSNNISSDIKMRSVEGFLMIIGVISIMFIVIAISFFIGEKIKKFRRVKR